MSNFKAKFSSTESFIPKYTTTSEFDAKILPSSGGAGDKTYIHKQSISSSEWNVTHGLCKYPSVTVVDSAKNVVVGEVQYISANQVVLRFSGAFTGEAYFN